MRIHALAPPRGFQFRLGTLLLAILWAAIVCMGLRTAGEPWSGILFVLATGSLLLAALMSIYRTGRTRAFALGFLICGGAYAYFSTGEQHFEDPSSAHPNLITTNWSIALYSRIHGDGAQMTVQTVTSPVPAPYPNWPVAPAASYQVVSETATMVPAMPPSAGTVAPLPPTETPISVPSTPATVAPSQPVITPVPMGVFTRIVRSHTAASLSTFLLVAHNSLLMLLGLIGGITAQYLHATRRDEASQPVSRGDAEARGNGAAS